MRRFDALMRRFRFGRAVDVLDALGFGVDAGRPALDRR
jgi:hypothetical protein